MKKISLTNSLQVALISNSSYQAASKHRWYLTKKGYARSTDHPPLFLHELVMGKKAPDGKQWDHEDRNKLNCRKSNLRLTTQSFNKVNYDGYKNNTSGFRGVSFFKGCTINPWAAQIGHNGNILRLGQFKTAKEAARKYDEKAFLLYGSFAVLNFPIQRFPRLRVA